MKLTATYAAIAALIAGDDCAAFLSSGRALANYRARYDRLWYCLFADPWRLDDQTASLALESCR